MNDQRKAWLHEFRAANSRGGFSLIEVIAVLALLGILAAAALFFAPSSAASVVAEADLLAAHLRYTQIRALGDVGPWRLEFSDTDSYQIERVGDSPVRIPGTQTDTRDLAADISLVTPPDEVRFDSWGRPVSASNVPLGSDLILTLTNGVHEIPVTITAGTGWIR